MISTLSLEASGYPQSLLVHNPNGHIKGHWRLIAYVHIAQVYCIFLFMSAVSLFGTIIAEVNEIVKQITNKKKDLEEILETYQSVQPR